MKLFTKDIDRKLFQQYPIGSDLEKQVVVAKIFNPYGRGVWYLLNSDPEDPDYIWAIVDLFEVEVGSVSRSELESIKVPPFNLHLERDLYFSPVNALELYRGLQAGKQYGEGGGIETDKDGNELFSKGGVVRYIAKDEEYRYKGGSSIESAIMDKIRGQISGLKFAGNFNMPQWKHSTDAYLYELDDFDKGMLSGIKLKDDEKMFRYYTRESAIGGMVLLIKLNVKSGLVYFPIYNEQEDKIVGFDSKGTRASYINLVSDYAKFENGGNISDVEFVDTEKGTFITPDDDNPNRVALLFKKGGLTGSVEGIQDELLKQKIEIFLQKMMNFRLRYYYIDQKTNVLYVGFSNDLTTDESEVIYKEATSSREFFDADAVEMKNFSADGTIQFVIPLKKEVIYAKGGSVDSRIQSMKESWEKEGKAFSHVSKMDEDKDFFTSIGVNPDKVGITSQTGNDVIYYNTEMYESDADAIKNNRKKFAKGGKTGVDKKYTHFAVRKSDNKIVTGWDYKGVDKEDISTFSKMDLKDMDIEPKTVSIVTKQYLIGKGIDPFSWDNWRDPKEYYEDGGSLNENVFSNGGIINGLSADEAIYLYAKRGLVQAAREKYLKPIGLWKTEKETQVQKSLIQKGALNSGGAITEKGKNIAKETDNKLEGRLSRLFNSLRLQNDYRVIKEIFEAGSLEDYLKLPTGGTIDDFIKWSDKIVRMKYNSPFKENSPITQWDKIEDGVLIKESTGELENGMKVVYDAEDITWWNADAYAKGGKVDGTKKYVVSFHDKNKGRWHKEFVEKAKASEFLLKEMTAWKKSEYKDNDEKPYMYSYVDVDGAGVKDFDADDYGDKIYTLLQSSKKANLLKGKAMFYELSKEQKRKMFDSLYTQDADNSDIVGSIKYLISDENIKSFAEGGMVKKKSKFADKVKAISANLVGKKVKPKYQKTYGKKYDPKEAKEAAKRIAGSIKAKTEKKK